MWATPLTDYKTAKKLFPYLLHSINLSAVTASRYL